MPTRMPTPAPEPGPVAPPESGAPAGCAVFFDAIPAVMYIPCNTPPGRHDPKPGRPEGPQVARDLAHSDRRARRWLDPPSRLLSRMTHRPRSPQAAPLREGTHEHRANPDRPPEPAVVALMTSMLQTLGHRIEEASSDRAAVRMLEHAPADLVLAGVEPADPDALEFLDYLRRKQPRTPVILVFAAPHPERTREALQRGASAVLRFPIPATQLRASVAQCLGEPEEAPASQNHATALANGRANHAPRRRRPGPTAPRPRPPPPPPEPIQSGRADGPGRRGPRPPPGPGAGPDHRPEPRPRPDPRRAGDGQVPGGPHAPRARAPGQRPLPRTLVPG